MRLTRIYRRRRLISYNQNIAKELAARYSEEINRVPLDYNSRERFATIVSQCSEDYNQSAKGTMNFYELKELVKHLYRIIISKVQNNAQ